jgi:peptide/nickel transport system permease protein
MISNRSWSVRIGAGIIAVFVIVAIAGPWFVGDPSATNAPLNAGPSAQHWLGTTNIGQDVLTQLVAGARGSLAVSTLAALIAIVAAVAVGVTSAVAGGIWDEILSLFTNAMLVIPTLPLVVVIAGYLRHSGNLVVAIVIAATGWSWSARILRAQALSLRRRDFVLASRASGEGPFRIVAFEVLPHLVPLIAAQFLGIVLYAIMTQAGLAFLGIGSVTGWTWGTMLYWANSAQAFQLALWWWYVPPGLCIALFGTALVLLNSAVDRISDRRMEERTPRGRPWSRRERPMTPAATVPVVAAEEVPV